MTPGAEPAGDLGVLAAWAPELADTFVALSSDIALVLDDHGRITRIAQDGARPIAPESWVGQVWADTVAGDSQSKAEQMLAELIADGAARRRELNLASSAVRSSAVAYSGVRLGRTGPLLIIGQDLSEQRALQQRFVAAQAALERSYWNAHARLRATAEPSGAQNRMTSRERASLGIEVEAASDAVANARLRHALDQLYQRIGHDGLPGLLDDVRHVTEAHFLQRALERAGSVDTLARWLGVEANALTRRTGMAPRPPRASQSEETD